MLSPRTRPVDLFRSLFVALLVISSSVAVNAVSERPIRAAGGGPVVIDGGDAGYHGSVFQGTLQSGWAYYGAWYRTLTQSVSGSYANDGRIAVVGAAASVVDLTDCGGGAHYAAASIGVPVDYVDGAGAISSFLAALASGARRPLLVHIVEETTDPNAPLCNNGLDASDAAALTAGASSIAAHVNRGGALFSNDQSYGWLRALYPSVDVRACGGFNPPVGTGGDAGFAGLAADHRAVPYHTCFTSAGSLPLPVIAAEANGAVIMGGASVTLTAGGSGGGATPDTEIDRCDGWCVTRLAGDDRFATAAAVSAAYWALGSTSAVLATGFNFPDAIAAGPLAARRGWPVLLTRATSLPSVTRTELRRLGVRSVVLAGGPAVIDTPVVSELIGMGITVTRLFGADRYDTSGAIAGQWSAGSTSTVVVASGASFGDQIVAAHLASRLGAPLVLMRPNGSVTDGVAREIQRLKPSTIAVVGIGLGSTAALDALRSGDTITRYTAGDVYALSLASQPSTMSTETPFFVASGADYPDALSGVAAAARARVPLLLSHPTCARADLIDFVDDRELADAVVLGGTRAVFEGISRLAPVCAS